MRILAARLNHETNTFSPVPTPLASFEPKYDADARAFGTGSNTAFGAFVDYATKRGDDLITPLAATANPSGPCPDEVFEALIAPLLRAVAGGVDVILLDLHGAMVSQGHEDCEGELLARIRALAPDVPLGVALDLHGNISAKIVENCDCIVGFKTYPHIDMYATGAHVTRIIEAMLSEGLRPHMALSHPPMLPHTLKMNTEVDCAMTDLIEQARTAEGKNGVLAATVFGGFGLSDIADAGLSIVTVATTPDQATGLAGELARCAWDRREDFVYVEQPLAQSLLEARSAADQPGTGPVLLLDHGDNCMSGGSCDNMDVLATALAEGMDGIIAGPICDPELVATLTQAGPGATVDVTLGNKAIAKGFIAPQPPLPLRGKVTACSDGRYVVSGPIYTGQACDMGRAVVLQTPQATILITERPHEPWDLGVFTSAGIDPLAARYLILKSRMYCRPVFSPLSRAVIECASGGITSSDYSLFSFERLKRPIYPLDSITGWPA
ncbi:M81 family metallopeptidase [Pseudorhodobacter aquimaris]|uniref:M81 family metallopeptidase n=1 Tax=Pseudorhodobacter aquimaris TaxID=687412 RepID=UPI00067B6A5F|nr:M81 family metallopeptidase [Pseudorhodobacter aquimaris]